MENAYSITVTNKFLLALDEDEDPLEILKLREQEREAKKKEKLSEKEKAKQQQHHQEQPHSKQNAASNKQKPRANKENQQQAPAQQQQQTQRNQDAKTKDQGDKKLTQQKFSGGERDRNVKFESREEHNNRRNREDGDRPPRAQNDFKRGTGEGREPRDYPQRDQQPTYREFRNSEYGGGERRGGRGRGMGRGRGGGSFRGGRGGYDNRGKREYDRQSGSDKTGVKPIDKRDGAGSHNWGTHNDEIEAGINTNDEWNNEKPEAEVAPGANDSAGSTAGEPVTEGGVASEEKPVEEETRELTLDEWKALRQSNRAKPQYNLRKAGEGEDLSRWKKMYALERKKEDDEAEEEEEYDAAEYPQRVGRQKHLFDIEINFSDSRRSAGGRGGRGGRGRGDRGGRGFNRGAPRGENDFRNSEQRSPRERQNAPKVDDEHDFPSLG